MIEIMSKEQAWSSVPKHKERYINIDTSKRQFAFRRRWFKHRNQCTFSTFLPERFPPDRPWNMLTIGVFEGAQEVWLMQNILRHPHSRLVSIDPWLETSKLSREFMFQCYLNAHDNLKPWIEEKKIKLIRGRSQDILRKAIDFGSLDNISVGAFDLCIIDGDHQAAAVVEDAQLCYEMAKPGGWLLFDDVRNAIEKTDHVKQGLEVFLADYEEEVELAWAHRFMDCYVKTEGLNQ